MALNLSTLTSPATSGDVLQEALTTADFLEPCPVLRNLSRGSNKGGDAKQDVALNQPKALPLIDGDGYLYLPPVSGNYASIPDEAALDITGDITLECDFIVPEFPLSANRSLLAKYNTSTNVRSYTLYLDTSGNISITLSQDGTFNLDFLKSKDFSSVLSSKTRATVKVTWRQSDGRTQFFIKESDGSFTQVSDDVTLAATSIYNSNLELEIGSRNSGQSNIGSSLGVFGARIYASVDGTDKRLDADFTATNVRHGATKFACATGQVVTINKSGNDPATIIKKPVLRFDGADDGFKGLFDQTITDGAYMFAAFSVLGSGGESWGRVFSVNKTGGFDFNSTGNIFSAQKYASGDLAYAAVTGSTPTHQDLFDDENGDILHQVKVTNSAQSSLVNGADFQSKTDTLALEAQEFNIGKDEGITENGAIDLEFLALFPATITDAQADAVRNYINNRNNVFSLVDNGYYFFDPQKADFTGNFTDANTLDGYITGSDNGDTDVRSNLNLVQATQNDQPSTDGYTITFNDAAEHLEFENGASQNLSGWQVVGTSLGTFAYRVDNDAVTELNLLGNLGSASFRQAGQSYGMILLPDSATGADIEAARKLLIYRGAADGTTASTVNVYFYGRGDIVEFKAISFSSATSLRYTWHQMSSLASFPSLDLTNAVDVNNAWSSCASLSLFGTTEITNCTDFTSAWQNCSALQSFPAGAKLGTEAENVNFQRAWESSGLTSFSTPLPTANDLFKAWNGCTSLESFSAPLTSATLINYAWNGCTSLNRFNSQLSSVVLANNAWQNCSSLTDFTTTDIKNCTNFTSAWQSCSSLQSFPAGAKLGTEASSGVTFDSAWRSSGLTSFSTPLPTAANVSSAWNGRSSLTSFDSEFPFVTSAAGTWANCTSLTSFSIDLPSATNVSSAFYGCSSLESFSSELPLGRYLGNAWRICTSLTDFSADVFANWNPSSIYNGVFDGAWNGCTSLTAQSVENILTSIDSSGKRATTTGAFGGTALADAGIDIDYNVATGSLSAATNAAVTSLKAKGWSIIVNNVTL